MVRSDPRGPYRTVASVERTPTANLTRMVECGHVAHLNAAMAPAKPGERVRCFACAAPIRRAS